MSRPATFQKGWPASIIWRILNREALCSDTAETEMCIYDTIHAIHMYVVCVKCGDVYIYIYMYIRTTILKIHMYHTCVCGICTYIYLHTIPLFYTYVCSSYIMYYIYIYICVCVCVNRWLCAPVIPMFVACNKKTTVLVHILGLSENKVLKPYGFSSSSPF